MKKEKKELISKIDTSKKVLTKIRIEVGELRRLPTISSIEKFSIGRSPEFVLWVSI